MSLRWFLPCLLATALAGLWVGSRLRHRAPAREAGPGAPEARAEEELANAIAAEDRTRLRGIAQEGPAPAVRARAALALVRLSPAGERNAWREAFLQRYPDSWLRRTWARETSR